MRLLRKVLGTWWGALILLAVMSGSVTAAITFRSAIPFGTASSWSSATGSDTNAVQGFWYDSINGTAQARANGADWQIDQGAGTGCVSPKSYGAVGDNSADDTVPVQAAITAAGLGGRVCFPSGKYRLSSITNVAPLTTPTFVTLEGPGYFLGSGIPAPVQLSFPNVGNGVGIQAGTNINIKNIFLEGPGTGTGVSSSNHIQLWSVQFDNWNIGLALNGAFYTRLYNCEFHADATGISATGVYNLDIYGGIWRVCPQAIDITDRIAALNLYGGSIEGWSSAAAITTGANSLINVFGVYFESSVSGNAGTAIKNTGTQNTINLIGNQVYLTEVSKWFDGNGQDTTTLFARGNKYVAAVGSTVTPTAYTLGINATGGNVDIADEDWTSVTKAGSVFISGGVTAGYFNTVGTTGAQTLTPGAASTMSTAGGTLNTANVDVTTAGGVLGVGATRAGTINVGSSGNTSLQTYKASAFSSIANNLSAGTPGPYNFATGTYTNITASTESIGVDFNIAPNMTWNTGNFAVERTVRVRQPTLKANAASTIVDAATFDVVGAPVCNSNMTCTNQWAIRVEAGDSAFGGRIVGTSGLAASYRSASSTVTVTNADYYVGVSGSGARTVNLPAANTCKAGQTFVIQEAGNSAGAITINRAGSDTINGGTSITLVGAYEQAIFVCDGTSAWFTDPIGASSGAAAGTWAPEEVGTSAVSTNFIRPYQTVANTPKMRNVACSWTVAGTLGTTGVVAQVVDTSNGNAELCNCTLGACTTTALTPLVCDCNSAAITAGHAYAFRLKSTSDCSTFPQNVACSVELTQ